MQLRRYVEVNLYLTKPMDLHATDEARRSTSGLVNARQNAELRVAINVNPLTLGMKVFLIYL